MCDIERILIQHLFFTTTKKSRASLIQFNYKFILYFNKHIDKCSTSNEYVINIIVFLI